jgi:hypothetical protein
MSASTQAGLRVPPSRRASVNKLALPAVAHTSRPSPGHPLFEDPYSLAVGVGHSRIASVSVFPGCITPVLVVPRAAPFASVVTGVGQQEEPLSLVRGADVSRGDDAALHAIPEPVEVGHNAVHPSSNEGPHVFDDDRARAELRDDALELSPESGPGAGEALPFARLRDVLTRESSTNHLHWLKVRGADSPHVGVPLCGGPVHRQHAAAPRVDLHLPPYGAEPGPLEAQLQPPDARE